jgi:hypothetical protein
VDCAVFLSFALKGRVSIARGVNPWNGEEPTRSLLSPEGAAGGKAVRKPTGYCRPFYQGEEEQEKEAVVGPRSRGLRHRAIDTRPFYQGERRDRGHTGPMLRTIQRTTGTPMPIPFSGLAGYFETWEAERSRASRRYRGPGDVGTSAREVNQAGRRRQGHNIGGQLA